MVFPCQVKFIAAIVTEAGNLLIHSDIVIVFAPAYYKLQCLYVYYSVSSEYTIWSNKTYDC